MSSDTRRDAWTTLIVAGGAGTTFVGVGVILFVNGDAIQRLFAIGSAAMGIVAITLALTAGLGGLRSGSAAKRDPPRPSAGGAIVYPRTGSAIVNVVVAGGAGVFLTVMMIFGIVVGAIAMAAIAGVMWLLIVPATIQSAVRVLRDPAALQLSPIGLRSPDVGLIPWSDIERLAIEDQRPLVARPGVHVVGSMRVLAIHLRPGAEPPRQGPIDRAMRWVAKGFVALGANAGYGRFHWLAIPERYLGVPLEEVLDAASPYRADMADLSAGAAPTAVPANTQAPATPVLEQSAAPTAIDADFGREADAIHTLLRADRPIGGVDAHESVAHAGWIGLGGALVGVAVGWWLGAALVASAGTGPGGGVPWPFLAFGFLIAASRAGDAATRRHTAGRASAFARPLRWTTAGIVIGFIVGAMATGALAGRTGQDEPASASPEPSASADLSAAQPAITVGASSVFAANTPGLAIDGDARTSWNAGASAPAWIELDLGDERTVTMIRLLTEQSPPGRTVHHILVASDDGAYTTVHVLDGHTETGRWLTFRPEAPLERVRAVVVETVESPSWVAWREIVIDSR